MPPVPRPTWPITDLSLLNQAREKLELIIDELYRLIRDQFNVKPKTYRQTAHKAIWPLPNSVGPELSGDGKPWASNYIISAGI